MKVQLLTIAYRNTTPLHHCCCPQIDMHSIRDLEQKSQIPWQSNRNFTMWIYFKSWRSIEVHVDYLRILSPGASFIKPDQLQSEHGWVITYFSNFNICTIEVWKWINNFISHLTGHIDVKFIRVNKRGLRSRYLPLGLNPMIMILNQCFKCFNPNLKTCGLAGWKFSKEIVLNVRFVVKYKGR